MNVPPKMYEALKLLPEFNGQPVDAPQPAEVGSQGDRGGEVAGDATTPCEVHQGVFDALTFEPGCSVCGLPQIDYVMREVGTNERGERLVVPVLTETPGTWVFGDTKETL